MRVHYVEQGTDKWLALRAGCITASSFKSLVTSRGEKTATSTRDTYLNQIIAETCWFNLIHRILPQKKP